MSSLMMR